MGQGARLMAIFNSIFLRTGLALFVIAWLLCASFLVEASVESTLLDDIKKSERSLTTTENRIAKDMAALAQKIHNKQRQVVKLRDETAVARRLADEQTLGLEQLQTRLQKWRNQDVYQQHLLMEFSEQVSQSKPALLNGQAPSGDIATGLQLLTRVLKNNTQGLEPTWIKSTTVMQNGEVTQGWKLQLGPVRWYWQPDTGQGGLMDSDIVSESVGLAFSGAALAGLKNLYENKSGMATLDPTLNQAIQLSNQKESLYQHLEKGGIWAIPILIFAALSLMIAAFKTVQLWRLPKLQPLLADRIGMLENRGLDALGDLQKIRKKLAGAQRKILDIAIKTPAGQKRDDQLFAFLLGNKHELEYLLGAIAVIAAVSPLLGLLGTVSGMIETFKMMTIFGAGDPSAVSGGISKALVTTELGLVVAIPSLILHALLSRWTKSYNSQLEATAVRLSQLQLPEKPIPEGIAA